MTTPSSIDSVIAYEPASAAGATRRPVRPMWLTVVALVASSLILAIFLLSLPPARQSGALNYTRAIPLTEAFAYAASPSRWRDVMQDRATAWLVWFFPASLLVLVAFIRARRVWTIAIIVLAAIILPMPFCQHHVKWLPVAAVLVLPPAVLGRLDGEDWSEGTVAFGCLGGWLIVWVAVGLSLIAVQGGRSLRRAGVSA